MGCKSITGLPPSIKFGGTHLYTWVERGTARVKCLAQEHDTMSLARARTSTTRSGVKCTNHEATAPPTILMTRPKFQCPIYDHSVANVSYPKHNFRKRSFFWTTYRYNSRLKYKNHTLKGKDIAIPLRASPKQAKPRSFGTAQRLWSPGQHCSLDNTEECAINHWMTEGKF